MKREIVLREKDLFPPLKKHFNKQGFKVFPEVPCFYRCIDFVAVKPDLHIAVEMKMSFNDEVVRQAHTNAIAFHKSYIAYPVKKVKLLHGENYWQLPERMRAKIDRCNQRGIGVLQIVGEHKIIVEVIEAVEQKPYRVFDFDGFEEQETDEAGLPFQKGRSSAFTVLDQIKRYVQRNPKATWQDIHVNVQHHYSSKQSLRSSMQTWKGFSLEAYKIEIGVEPEPKKEEVVTPKLF